MFKLNLNHIQMWLFKILFDCYSQYKIIEIQFGNLTKWQSCKECIYRFAKFFIVLRVSGSLRKIQCLCSVCNCLV